MGSITINPAGLGLYRSTDFCVTPGLLVNSNATQFNGSYQNQAATKIFINQAGIAFTSIIKKASKQNEFSFNSAKLNSFTFAINYQKQASLSNTQNFSSLNNSNSGIDAYTGYLNSTKKPLNTDNYPIEMLLAYQANLISHDSISGNYFSRVHAPLTQTGTMINKGSVDQIDLAMGFNVNDKFYLGAGVGIPIVTFLRDASFTESASKDTTSSFIDYTFASNLRVTGVGVNAKFGFVYRPTAWMRFGIAYHIPTFYNLTETYSSSLTANFTNGYLNPSAQADPFKYKLRSPMKGVISASFYLKEHGFFSVDYEFVNYGASHVDFGANYKTFTDEVNAYVKNNYTFGHVVRTGFEGSYKSLRLRAGYVFTSTPYKGDLLVKGFTEMRHNATAGIGYRGKRFYADLAYVFGITKSDAQPYADFDVRNTNISHTIFLTLGWRIPKT